MHVHLFRQLTGGRVGCTAAVREAFVRLHDKGLVYRGSYLVNWSPAMQTAVSDLEVCCPSCL